MRFQVTEDMVSQDGFSVQLNAYPPGPGPNPPPGYPTGASWAQYIISVRGFLGTAPGPAIRAATQYWDIGAWMACGGCINSQTVPVNVLTWLNPPIDPLILRASTIPKGSVFEIDLANDDNGNVSGAAFTFTDNEGNTATQTIPIDPVNRCPIVAFQVNVVGADNSATAQFSSGAGVITYESEDQLCVEGGLPDLCSNSSGSSTPTAEQSNATYGPIGPHCCGSQLSQSLST